MSYNHFTIEKRIKLQGFLDLGLSMTEIAKQLKVHKATVSREIKRNQIGNSYEPIKAQSCYQERRKRCHKRVKLTAEVKQHIENRINLTWSPEQIVGRKEDKPADFPCVSTIYEWIHKGYIVEGGIKALRRKGKNTATIQERKRCKTDIGKSIRKRPKSVYKRERIGDWEADTVMGKQGTKSCFVTLLERKSRFYLADFLPNHTSEVVCTAIIRLLSKIPKEYIKTITFDRGRENAKWRKIEKKLKCKTYFCDAYCSWQKGSNENANGLLREFFPKSIDLNNTQAEEVIRALYLLNNRPRKCLNYRTPAEVFYEEILST